MVLYLVRHCLSKRCKAFGEKRCLDGIICCSKICIPFSTDVSFSDMQVACSMGTNASNKPNSPSPLYLEETSSMVSKKIFNVQVSTFSQSKLN